MYTNINIKQNTVFYNYIVEYQRTDLYVDDYNYAINEGICLLNDKNISYIQHHNYWNLNDKNKISDYMPPKYKMAYINLYFPLFSADIYNEGIEYMLNLYTWVGGTKIVLGCFPVSRLNSIASETPKMFLNQQYLEYIQFQIIDPYSIIYDDEWKDFRRNVCKESTIENDLSVNNTGSMIYASLYIVNYENENYFKSNKYTGGQNSINISTESDFLSLHIKSNTTKSLLTEQPSILYDLKFNEIYNGNLSEYLLETYNIKNCSLKYSLTIGNEDELFVYLQKKFDIDSTNISFTKEDILKTNNFQNWIGWKEGIYIIGSVDVLDENGEIILYILSNKLPFTQSLYKYFVNDNFYEKNKKIHCVNLNTLDMNLYNLNIPNRIENKIVQVQKIDDVKSNIIKPVFYRSEDSINIIIHPDVTETISINLDQYKSKVNTFILKIGNTHIKESGRISAGVLFKIPGRMISVDSENNTYYILNEEEELVTSGKYTCIR